MPAVRLSRRRRSSLGIFCGDGSSVTPIKPGNYGIYPSAPRPVTFAPNVTPGTFVEPDDEDDEDDDPDVMSNSPTSALFPPSQPATAPSSTRRRVPPGKRRSLGYIPRPPNAFMLFRADFVRQKHVPGSIETNHGSLSKIIGNCWRSLPLEEKRIWEVKAKHAKAEHKARYPNYRFRPVHNKNKDKKKQKPLTTPEDERRCDEVAQLLLEGKKGDDLAAAVRDLDRIRGSRTPPLHVAAPQPHHALGQQELSIYAQRRSSSVPLPGHHFPPAYFSHAHPQHRQGGGIALPSIPQFTSRPASPVRTISRSQRMMLGQRRASSARPDLFRSWTVGDDLSLPYIRDHSPLPEPDTSLFESTFFDSSFGFSSPFGNNGSNKHDTSSMSPPSAHPFGIHSMMNSLPPQALGPLDVLPHAQEHMQHDPTINTASASSASSEYDLGANDHSSSSYGALSSASSTQPLPEVHPMGAWYPPTSIQADNTVAAASNTWAHDIPPSEVGPYDASHSQMNLPVEVGGMGAGVDRYDPGMTYDTSYEVEAPSFGAETEANVYAHPQASLYQHPAHPLVDQTQGCGAPMGSLATYDGAIFADQVHAQCFEQWDASAAQTQTWA